MHPAMVKITLSILLGTLTLTSQAGMRCHGKLINVGAIDYEVLQACGEPKYKHSYTETPRVFNPYTGTSFVTTVNYQRWIYQASSNSFRYVLLFEEGVLKSMESGRNP